MKKSFLYLIIIVATFWSACTKENQRIEYPLTGTYGRNILTVPNGDTIPGSSYFSLAAELGRRADLKVVMTNLSEQASGSPASMWFYSDENGWSISEYSSDTQEFISNKSKTIDMNMVFGGKGKCKIDLYENSKSITQSKILFWK